jgi:hypothetical protein
MPVQKYPVSKNIPAQNKYSVRRDIPVQSIQPVASSSAPRFLVLHLLNCTDI